MRRNEGTDELLEGYLAWQSRASRLSQDGRLWMYWNTSHWRKLARNGGQRWSKLRAACICCFTNSHASGYIQDVRLSNSRQRPSVCLPERQEERRAMYTE